MEQQLLLLSALLNQVLANYVSPLSLSNSVSPWTSTQTRNQHVRISFPFPNFLESVLLIAFRNLLQISGEYAYSINIHAPTFAQSHWEKSNAYNEREGSYSFRDAYGRQRIVRYVADKHGFRPIIQSNEPGLALKPSAHVIFSPLHSSASSSYAPVTYTLNAPSPKSPVGYIVKSIKRRPIVIRSIKSSVPEVQYSSIKPSVETLHSQYSAPVRTSAVLPPLHAFTWPQSYQVLSTKPYTAPVLYHTTSSFVGPVPHSPSLHRYASFYSPAFASIKPKAKIVPHIAPAYTSTLVSHNVPSSYVGSNPSTLDGPVPSLDTDSIAILKTPIPSSSYVLTPKPIRRSKEFRLHSLATPPHLRYL